MSLNKRLLSLFILLLIASVAFPTSTPAHAQQDNEDSPACVQLVDTAIQAVGAACSEMGRDEACYGNTLVAATFTPTATALKFNNQGDVVDVIDLQAIATEPANPEAGTWGIALLKVLADLPEAEGETLTFVLLGDVEVNNVNDTAPVVPVCDATNGADAVNIYAGPGEDRPILSVLPALVTASANGRSLNNAWLRMERNGLVGWVDADALSLACSVDSLEVAREDDLSTAYTLPMQAFTIDTSGSQSCANAPNGVLVQAPEGQRARVLVNGVVLDISSAGLITAEPDGALGVTGLEGAIQMAAQGKNVKVDPGFIATVPLNGLTPGGQPSDPQPAFDTAQAFALLNSIVYGGANPSASCGYLSSNASSTPRMVGDAIMVDLVFTGDATLCNPEEPNVYDVVLVLDNSGSMTPDKLASAKGAAANFIAQLDPNLTRVGVVSFDSSARQLVALTNDYNRALNGVYSLSSGGGTAIDQGLLGGYQQLANSNAESRAVLLLSDGGSDPGAAYAAASTLSAAGIRIITVAVGEDADRVLMGNLATTSIDAFATRTAVDLRDSFNQAVLSLNGVIAARDALVTFRFDPANYALVTELLDPNAKEVEPGLIEWRLPIVYDRQVHRLTPVLRPLTTGEMPLGSADATFFPGSEGDQSETRTVSSPLVNITDISQPGGTVSPLNGALTIGNEGVSTLTPFGAERWLIDVPASGLFSLLVAGAGDRLPPQVLGVSGVPITPLYSLLNYQDQNQALHVFKVPQSGLTWLYIQSESTVDVGRYSVRMNDAVSDRPTATLSTTGVPVEFTQANYDGQTFGVDLAAGEFVTLEIRRTRGDEIFDLQAQIVNFDGSISSFIDSYYDFPNRVVMLFKVLGEEDNRIFVRANGEFTIQARRGDGLREYLGEAQLNESYANVSSNEFGAGKFTFEAKEPGAYVFIMSQASAFTYPYFSITKSDDGTTPFASFFFRDQEYASYIFEIEEPGFYDISAWTALRFRDRSFVLYLGEKEEAIVYGGELPFFLSKAITPEAPRYFSYDITADNQVVTLYLETGNDAHTGVVLRGADGTDLTPEITWTDSGGDFSRLVYELNGNAPYTFEFFTGNSYTLLMEPGNTLTPSQEPLTISEDEVRGRTNFGKLGASYPLQVPANSAISISATGGRSGTPIGITVRDADFDLLQPIETLTTTTPSNLSMLAFELGNNGPYTTFIEAQGSFTVLLEEGNTVRLARNRLLIGDLEIPGRGSSAAPPQYTLDVESGQTVTVEVAAQGARGEIAPEVLSSDGIPQTPTILLQEPGYVMAVYALEGEAPFDLGFALQGNFTISLQEGDQSAVFKGAARQGLLETTHEGRIRRLIYEFTPTADTPISLQLETASRSEITVQMVDTTGELVLPEVQVSEPGSYTAVFQLETGASYQIIFGAVGDYSLTLINSDIVRVNKGVVRYGDTLTGKVDPPARAASYTLEGTPGDVVSILVKDRRESQPFELRDSMGEVLQPFDEAPNTRTREVHQVFELTGTPPYTLIFDGTADYTLSVVAGNIRRFEGGVLPYGEAVNGTPVAPTLLARYQIEGNAGDVVSVQLVSRAPQLPTMVLNAGDDSSIEPLLTATENRQLVNVFELVGEPPYILSFDTDQPYTLTLTRDNLLEVAKGAISLETPIEDTLTAPSQAAIYTLEGEPGQAITITLTGRNALAASLSDALGNTLVPVVDIPDRGSLVQVYRLSGEAPYSLKLTLRDAYTLLVNGSDTVRVERGSLAAGVITEDSLEAPALVGLYTITGESGAFISAETSARNGRITLVDGLDNPIPVFSEVRIQGRPFWVFRLRGEPPYRLGVEGQGDFTVTVSPGDVSREETGVVLLNGAPQTGRLTGGFQAVYNLNASEGDDLVLYVVNNRDSVITAAIEDADGNVRFGVQDSSLRRDAQFYFKVRGRAPYRLLLKLDGSYTLLIPNAPAEEGLLVKVRAAEAPLYDQPANTATAQGTLSRDTNFFVLGRTANSAFYMLRSPSGAVWWVARSAVDVVTRGDDLTTLPILRP